MGEVLRSKTEWPQECQDRLNRTPRSRLEQRALVDQVSETLGLAISGKI